MKDKLLDIFLRRIDSYINPKIENRVIYGSLLSGVSLVLSYKFADIIDSISIKSKWVNLTFQNSTLDESALYIGFTLIAISAITLYIFRIHKRPEFVIESDSPSAKRWINYGYSFTNKELINPLILKDLVGWVSDSGRQIVSIDIPGSNISNRYFGEIKVREYNGRKMVEVVTNKELQELFGYEYLGTSESGIHVVHAYDRSLGTAIFHWVLLLQIEESSVLEFENSSFEEERTPVLKLVGRLPLGDWYSGNVTMSRGAIRIDKDLNHMPNRIIKAKESIVIK